MSTTTAHKYLLHTFVQSTSFQQLFKWKKGKNQNKETFDHHHYIATAEYKGYVVILFHHTV